MNIILWFAIGIVTGLLAARFLETKTPWATGLNVATGILGALVGGFVIAPIMGVTVIVQQGLSMLSLLASSLGALLLLAFFNFVRPSGLR